MTQSNGFKHISVTSDVDDDVVIHAGIGATPEQAPIPDMEAVEKPDCFESSGFEATAAPQQGVLEGSHIDEQQVQPSAELNVAAPANDKKTDAGDGYRETTLDDLSPAPMSGMQKGIIVVAVLVILAALVYYMVFMR